MVERMLWSFFLMAFVTLFLIPVVSFAQRWDFTSSVEGWIACNTNTNIRWSPDGEGRLYMDTYGSDPQLFNQDVYLDLLRK